MNTSFLRRTVGAMAIAFAASSAQASSLILDNFAVVGSSESLSASFWSRSTSTVKSYSGFIEINVSGTGWSNATRTNDAFYDTASKTSSSYGWYQLDMATGNKTLSGGTGKTNNIQQYITFINDVGSVAPGTRPAFSTKNGYDFVVNVSSAGKLAFGVSDGVFGDNGGAYQITVSQLKPVPLPAAMWLFGSALVGMFGFARRTTAVA